MQISRLKSFLTAQCTLLKYILAASCVPKNFCSIGPRSINLKQQTKERTNEQTLLSKKTKLDVGGVWQLDSSSLFEDHHFFVSSRV